MSISSILLARKKIFRKKLLIVPLAVSALVFSGCGSDDGGSQQEDNHFLDMAIPDSLTGGTVDLAVASHTNGNGQPCVYAGAGNEDPFKNGYNMSRMLVSAVATWTCVADTLIDVAAFYDHDAAIHATDNDTSSASYRPQDPTHYSITDDSVTQTTIKLYYGYDQSAPPVEGVNNPGFYVSWNTADSGDIEGKLIIDATAINPDRNVEDPNRMRMDFDYTSMQKHATMYLSFDSGNQWADGFAIDVTKDLTANPAEQVFTAKGMIEVKRQFHEVPLGDISELPTFQVVAVSNALGRGAAVAEYVDFALPLVINPDTNNNLGNYLFTKTDEYYFHADRSWEYINKNITSAEYRGSRTTQMLNADPADPDLTDIINYLSLDADYFTGTKCNNIGDSCVEMLNALHQQGWNGQELNQGTDPMDWRTTALGSTAPLTSVYPNGTDWTGAFDFTFTPSN